MRSIVPNALSLSRIGLALIVLLTYDPTNRTSFIFALIVIFIALATDFADGYLARQWGASGETGYVIDGLADRSFYVALVLTIVAAHSLALTSAWLLIIREISMHALRLLQHKEWFEQNTKVRAMSLWQAGSIRIWFLTYFVADWLALFTPIRLYDEVGYLGLQYFMQILTICTGYLGVLQLLFQLRKEKLAVDPPTTRASRMPRMPDPHE